MSNSTHAQETSNQVIGKMDLFLRLLDSLIDQVGEDEAHPLASLMEVVGTLVEKYEDEHVPELV